MGISENIAGMLRMDWEPEKSRYFTPAENLLGEVCLPLVGQVLKRRNSTNQCGGAP